MIERVLPEIPVHFYKASSGTGPVLEWLRDLPREDRRSIGIDLMRVQVVRNIGDGLWEIRSTLPSRRIARLLLCFHEGAIVVLHGFIKKTQKTPPDDLELARKRKREVTG